MRELLIVAGLFVLAVALRSCRRVLPHKLGAVVVLAATFCALFFATGRPWAGALGVAAWFFLPWVELLTRVRRMRLPLENRLRHRRLPNPALFPNAEEAASAMEEAGFEHVNDCGREWGGMQQFFRLFWHPEERSVAAVCLCEQSDISFCFMTLDSRDEQGRLWRTTNFPFSPTLLDPPQFRWNRVPCDRNCFHQLLRDHHRFLRRGRVVHDDLVIPDPELLVQDLQAEMRACVAHNLHSGIIRLTGDGHFRYSPRGLLFLWKQYVKDMVRLC